jgi:serine/threonine-protein kinase
MSRPLFGKFKIRECLKQNSVSSVYRARHIYLNKDVLLKTLDRKALADRQLLSRFKREARLLAQLDHPNIIRVLDFGVAKQSFYISFEYIHGETLRELMSRQMSLMQKREVLAQVASGLQAAHDKGIIHRDIKPENILIEASGTVKLADFGLALSVAGETGTGVPSTLVGTPGYMPPELIEGASPTPASDLYSLGLVACEWVTGRHPFLGDTVSETFAHILAADDHSVEQYLKEVPEPTRSSIQQLMRRRPQDRRNEWARSEPIRSDDARTSTSPRSTSRSKWIGITVTALLIASLTVWFGIMRSPGPAPQQDPDTRPEKSITKPKPETQTPVETDTAIPRQESPKERREPVTMPVETPAAGLLTVDCRPWAEVWIDSQHIDTTPMEQAVHIQPGTYALTLKNPAFPPVTQDVTIQPGQEKRVQVKLDTLFGYLTCDVFPWGEVWIDGRQVGQTPMSSAVPLLPGEHQLTVRHPTSKAATDVITVVRSETLRYHLNFERLVQ